MRPTAEAGFSLVEMLIAIALTGAIAAAVFLLLSVGMKAQDQAGQLSLDVLGSSETASLLQADLARADDVVYAGSDSLQLQLFDGELVAYATRPATDATELYRSTNSGTGWKEDPMRPLATLADGQGESGRAEFASLGTQRVRARLFSRGRPFEIEGSLWRTP